MSIRTLLAPTPLARKSLADVTRRKGRTLLVVLGILIGVLGLTAINVAAGSLGAAFAYSGGKTPTPDVVLSVEGATPDVAALVTGQPNVKTVQVVHTYSTRWQIAATPGHANIVIAGYYDFNNIKLNPFQITSGHTPGPGEIVMETSDRVLQNFNLGDTVTIETPHGPTKLTIVGTSRTLGRLSAAFSSNARAYMDANTLSAIDGVSGPTQVQAQVFDKAHERDTLKALTALLAPQHITVTGGSTIDDYWDPGPINGLFTVMRALSLIALVLTSFLILNTVTTLVAEQTKIIGTMKAVGATRWTVMRGYLTSVGVYGIIGTALGIGLGIVAGYALASYLATVITLDLGPFSVDAGVIVVSILVGLGIPFAAALVPLWTGTRITVREAMAAYGVSGGNGRRAYRPSRLLAWAPQTMLLGLRGIFRKRGRAVLTLLALTLSAAAFLSIQTTTYSADRFIGQLFNQYGFDVFVGAKPQPYAQMRAKLLAIPNVAQVERLQQDTVKTTWGTMLLTGVEQDAQLYHHTIIAGRWFNPGEPNALVMSDNLATKTGLHVGDSITFSTSTDTVTWHIIGEVHDVNGGLGLIGVGLTTIDNFNALQHAPSDLSGSFMIQAVDRSPAAVNQLANTLDSTLSAQGLNPSVSTAQQQIARNKNQFQILYVLLYSVAAIVAMVGILGLFNTLTTSVLERRREIGILRSMGATGWRVAGVFWTEGLALSVIAWLVAVVIGIPAAYGFLGLISAALLPIPFAFDPISLIVMLVFILVIATLASLIPALSAARVRIADTLRYE
ncbi:MAG: hypothetical protein OJF49_003936 [Ktedonobacterales bacterium]|jgi:putative ABC transport system permease protein|nr:MAG: hypothetical protein OJF49_003936 [Ktedonobacterales bacterium]